MLSALKYLQSHIYDKNHSHFKHMFLYYIMLWIHVLNISVRGRRKRRWNKRIAEQNPGGVEEGALYGGENTCQVNKSNILSGKPQFMDFGINVFFMYSSGYEKFFEEQSVFSALLYMRINVYEHKNILPPLVWSLSKFLKHQTVQIHSSHISANKQNSNSWHCDNVELPLEDYK